MSEERPQLQQLFIVCDQCGVPNYTGIALRFVDLAQVRRSYRFGKTVCGQCNHEISFSEGTLLPESALSDDQDKNIPQVNIQLTVQELRIINNALNEVCNGVDLKGEFYTRIGCTVDKGRDLLAKIKSALRNA